MKEYAFTFGLKTKQNNRMSVNGFTKLKKSTINNAEKF